MRIHILLTLLIMSLLATGCDSSGDEENLSPEESAQRISTAVTDLDAEITRIEDGEFMAFMNKFMGGTGFSKVSWGETLLTELTPMLDLSSPRFDMNANAGVYSWDAASGSWTKTDGDDFILNFPSSAEEQSNDVTFALTEYADTPVTVENETAYLPTRLLAELTYAGTLIARVDLNGVQYGFNGEPLVPASAEAELFMHPVTQSIDWGITTASADFSYAMSRDDDEIMALVLDVLFAPGAFDGPTFSESGVESVAGSYTLGGELELRIDADVAGLNALETPTADAINDLMKAEIYYRGSKLADIRLDEQMQAVIVYGDGTTEPAAQFYAELMDHLEGGSGSMSISQSVIEPLRQKVGL